MPTPPYAQLTVSVNGGGAQTGPVVVTSAQTVQLGMGNASGVFAQAYEIYGYPAGFSPGGAWTLGADGYTWQNTKAVPDSFSTGSLWGKWMLRLRVNGNPLARNADGSPATAYQPQLTDESTALTYLSPGALRDLGFLESTQFNAHLGWLGDHQANLRALAPYFSTPTNAGFDFTALSGGNTTSIQSFIGFQGLTGGVTCKLPASPFVGQLVTLAALDTTVSSGNPVSLNPNGNPFIYQAAGPALSKATTTQTVLANKYESGTWEWNGLLWSLTSWVYASGAP